MNRLFKLAFLDIKMMFKSIVFIGGLVAAVLFLVLFLIRRPHSFHTENYMYMFFEVMKYIFIINSVMVLGRDYNYGTYKYLFTGTLTRSQVILQKLMTLTIFGLMCGLVQTAVRTVVSIVLNGGINKMDLFSVSIVFEIWLYMIFALLTGCFSMMLLGITKKVKITFISAISLFGIIQYYSSLFILLLMQEKPVGFWVKTIFYTPIFIIWNWVQQSIPTVMENALMFVYIFLMLVVALIVINKKDMNIEQKN